MTPELVDTPSVDRAFMLAPGIGYMRITSFDAATGKLVKDTIEKLGGDKLKGLVIDLRDNPGGVVQAAVETASLFLQPSNWSSPSKAASQKTEEVRVPKIRTAVQFPAGGADRRQERERLGDRHRRACRITTAPPCSASPAMARAWCRTCIRFRAAPAWR